jgi:hypothetical protein
VSRARRAMPRSGCALSPTRLARALEGVGIVNRRRTWVPLRQTVGASASVSHIAKHVPRARHAASHCQSGGSRNQPASEASDVCPCGHVSCPREVTRCRAQMRERRLLLATLSGESRPLPPVPSRARSAVAMARHRGARQSPAWWELEAGRPHRTRERSCRGGIAAQSPNGWCSQARTAARHVGRLR